MWHPERDAAGALVEAARLRALLDAAPARAGNAQ
jgi:hypothetical protein